jgi:hypothetical protein
MGVMGYLASFVVTKLPENLPVELHPKYRLLECPLVLVLLTSKRIGVIGLWSTGHTGCFNSSSREPSPESWTPGGRLHEHTSDQAGQSINI